MRKLTKEQILLLHQNLIDSSGGSSGLRDEGLLESAIYAPFQSMIGMRTHLCNKRRRG